MMLSNLKYEGQIN